MKRIVTWVIIAVFSVFLSSQAKAQLIGGPDFMDKKIVLGGDFSLGLNGNSFGLGVAPQAGYRLTRSLEVGARLGYNLYYYQDYYYGEFYYHYFSGSLYANCEVTHGFYLHIEDEEMCSLVRGTSVNPSSPEWYNSFFVGAGYRKYYSEKSLVFLAVLYNLSWDYFSTSPYNSPFVIRAGYCFSL